jgi:haloalkane dehalogenase
MATVPLHQTSSAPAFPFDSKFISVHGHRIHYVDVGSGDPILFVHGNPTSSYLWRNVLPNVAARTGRRGIAIDLLGFGKSDKPSHVHYSLKLHAEIIEGLIHQLGLENIVLVADDWGGPLGTYVAVRHPEAFQGIALMETFLWTFTWNEDFAPEFRVPFKLMRTPLGFIMIQMMNFMTKKLIPQHCPISQDSLDYYVSSCPTIASRKAMREFPRLLPVEGKPKESVEFFAELQNGLPHLQCPVLWIKASPGIVPSDDFPPSLRHFDELRKRISHFTIEEFGPGHHFLAEENPEQLCRLLVEWMSHAGLTQATR